MRAIATALQSAAAFPSLVAGGRLHQPRRRVGSRVRLLDDPRFTVFRETSLDDAVGVGGAVLLVGFRLRLLGRSRVLHWLFRRVCVATTPFWAGVPGFRTKLWLTDPKTFDYGGAYEWESAPAAERYAAELTPLLRRLSVPGTVWHVVEAPRTLTGFLDTMSRSTLSRPVEGADHPYRGRIALGR